MRYLFKLLTFIFIAVFIATFAQKAQARCLRKNVIEFNDGEFIKGKNCKRYPDGDGYCRYHYGQKYQAVLTKGCELHTSYELSLSDLKQTKVIKKQIKDLTKAEVHTTDTFLHQCFDESTNCVCPEGLPVDKKTVRHYPSSPKYKTILSCQPTQDIAQELFTQCTAFMNQIGVSLNSLNAGCQFSVADQTNLSSCFKFNKPAGLKYTDDYPQKCGFSTSGLIANFSTFKSDMKSILGGGDDLHCYPTICTTATSLAMAQYYRDNAPDNGEARFEDLTQLDRMIRNHLNISATPNELVEELGIGKGYVQHASLFQIGQKLIPQSGDFVQIWRNNNPQTGHSVVFKGFLKNDEGSITDICYWSSQSMTSGFGEICEDITRVEKLLIGHLHHER